MQTNTFYIEYLIVGGIGLVLYVNGIGYDLTGNGGSAVYSAIFFVPAAYLVGVVIDAVGVPLEWSWRWLSENRDEHVHSGSRTAVISAYNERLALRLATLRSRDRIIRGAFIVVCLTACIELRKNGDLFDPDPSFYNPFACQTAAPDGRQSEVDCNSQWQRPALAILLLMVWLFVHDRTRAFKAAAFALSTGGLSTDRKQGQ